MGSKKTYGIINKGAQKGEKKHKEEGSRFFDSPCRYISIGLMHNDGLFQTWKKCQMFLGF